MLEDPGRRDIYVPFQFYDSPIKRFGVRRMPRSAVVPFQFYDSPIKRYETEESFILFNIVSIL